MSTTGEAISAWNSDRILFAGPCAAETEMQVVRTAEEIAPYFPGAILRAGIWKPRTQPGAFEGVGEVGLKWLQTAREQSGLRVAVEVGNARHVEQCLKHGIDVLWIGARTTGNPFSVQEIADALKGVPVPVFIKNPLSPQLSLWQGAIDRLSRAGTGPLGAIFRGFFSYEVTQYRNVPRWEVAIDFKSRNPALPLICDISHIAGNTSLLHVIAQQAINLEFEGLMIETHCDPAAALSDAEQQLTPDQLYALISSLEKYNSGFTDPAALEDLTKIRLAIDEINDELLKLLARRIFYSDHIARLKSEYKVSIFQPDRMKEILQHGMDQGELLGLNRNFVRNIFIQIHDESVRLQGEVMSHGELSNKS